VSTATAAVQPQGLPVQPVEPRRGRSTAKWGMAVLIMTEATIFAGLIGSYFFVRAEHGEWPPPPIEAPELEAIALFSIILLGSSGPMVWAEHGIRHGQQWRLRLGLLLTFLMGTAFICFQGVEYVELDFGIKDNAYASLFYTITGLHGLHVLIGLLMILMIMVKAWMGKFSGQRHLLVEMVGLYWHFVDAVWVFVFSSLYLSSHLK
jgi:heme/copper-type cytochrome/quinol oxidase subunit 3